MHFKLTPTVSNIIREVERIGKRIWVVGGAVRDNIMGKTPKDLDFATNYDHKAMAVLLKRMGLVVIPDKTAKSHGIVRVVDRDSGDIIDIARLRRDDTTDGRHAVVSFTDILAEDLERRDFTVNAMACEIDATGHTRNFVDLFNGRQDIQNKVVRFVGHPHDRITEDFLRMIRACRFTALDEGWRIADNDRHALKVHAQSITEISKERIRDEIVKALGYDKPSNFFRALHTAGLLAIVFPDLEKGVGCAQNEYHAEPVFDHLVRCCDVSVDLTDNVMLRLAALTHDIAKPHTRSVDSDGRVHFYKHEVEGEYLMRAWMREYKFSRKDIEYVTKLVRHHQWRFNDNSKDITIRKFLNTVGRDVWRDLITLRCADRKGNLKKADRPMITWKMRQLMQKAQDIIDSGVPVFKEDLAINGHDLKRLGVKPGRVYQEIFSNMMGIVINDPSKNTREWLEKWVTKNYVR